MHRMQHPSSSNLKKKSQKNHEKAKTGPNQGESVSDYHQRLDRETNLAIVQAIKEGSQFGAQRKLRCGTTEVFCIIMTHHGRMKELKKKRKEKKMKQRQPDSDDDAPLKDEVRFGEVSQAPPVLTARPKPPKQRVQTTRPSKLSLRQQEILKDARKEAIQLYRQRKLIK
jgi:hypothetical protein